FDRVLAEQHLADEPADRAIARLAREVRARAEPLDEAARLRRRAGAVETFDDDEATRTHEPVLPRQRDGYIGFNVTIESTKPLFALLKLGVSTVPAGSVVTLYSDQSPSAVVGALRESGGDAAHAVGRVACGPHDIGIVSRRDRSGARALALRLHR